MSYSLVYSAKPHSTSRIRVYDSSVALDSNYVRGLRACSKLVDSIFTVKANIKPPKRLHIKGNKYMYIPSDEYEILVRVKNFSK
jgi:hypothetical protein